MKNFLIILLVTILFAACHPKVELKTDTTKLFSKGKRVSNDNFTGEVWLNMLLPGDTTYNSNMGSVSFEPGARTNWHYHPGGQILIVTEGTGWYQERGKEIQIIRKSDVVKCLPNIEHWHGASANYAMSHVAIGTNINKGAVVWLEPVTSEEYNKGK